MKATVSKTVAYPGVVTVTIEVLVFINCAFIGGASNLTTQKSADVS
jgi:hypothetical protein